MSSGLKLSIVMTSALLAATSPSLADDDIKAAIRADIARAKPIVALQPPAELIPQLEELPVAGQDGARIATEFDQAELGYQLGTIIVKDYLPYYPYYALK